MIQSCSLRQLETTRPEELADGLEFGNIVHFPASPVPFPSGEDLDFLRVELPRTLHRKNISYHPEVRRVVGVGGGREIQDRARRILEAHSRLVREFLERSLRPLAQGWTVATSSFRPLQEKGRALSAHASNERVHVDAGAYGATHGNRILRFFMNAHPAEERVWVTKGNFPDVYRRFGRAVGLLPADLDRRDLSEGVGNRLYSRLLDATARWGLPVAKLADTSPYDRLMRRFHNFMKDSPEFQETPEGHRRFECAPGSAWMVFTDMVTHACVSGQHAFIDTFIVPLANCRHRTLTPYSALQEMPK